jgi:hypothetical protein
MFTLQGRAIGMLGSAIVFGLLVYFFAIRGEVFAPRPDAREPSASKLEKMIAGTVWSTDDVQFMFARDGQLFSGNAGNRAVGTWRALDGSIRIRSGRGEVTYAVLDGDAMTIGPDRLTRVSAKSESSN